MKENFFKKTAAFILALCIVSGGLPQTSGGGVLLKPATTADAADEPQIGDILKFGDYLDGYYKNYDGSTIRFIGDETDPNTIIKITEVDWKNSRIHIQEYANYLNDELWVNIPTGRELEEPTGIKIIAGDGSEESPYQLELVYSGEPMGAFEEVKVGKKWYIGDVINTDAYFSVPVIAMRSLTVYMIGPDADRTTKFMRKKLQTPELYPVYASHEEFLFNVIEFNNLITGCFDDEVEYDLEKGVYLSGSLEKVYNTSFGFKTDIDDGSLVKGIEVTGGSGTKEDPFTLAPITEAKESIVPAVGKVIKWGDRLELGELYLKDEYYYTKTGELISKYLILGEPKYLDDKDMWSIGYVEGAALCAVKTDTERHYEIPIGVKIVSGTGAYNDPFTMELVYSGDAVTPEEVTVGKKWYVGDTINTDAYFIGGRGLVIGESDAPTRISFDSNSCKFHLINKKLSSAYELQDNVSEEDFLVFPDTVSTTYTDFGVEGDGYPTGLAFETTSGDIIGIEVTGGSGTKEDPFTLAPIIVATDETTANKVIKAIDTIGTVEYTPSCKAKIVAARKAYDALTDAQKALVTNYATLTKAEADYAKLDTEGAAAKVDALISAIGTVELTDACKAKITAARAAYDALTDAQKALVTNYETLTKAEADYTALELAALGGEAVTTLISNINSIDTAIWGAEPDLEVVGKAITAAKTAYAALDKELQPKVTNYNTLLKDEKYYSALKSATDAKTAQATAEAAAKKAAEAQAAAESAAKAAAEAQATAEADAAAQKKIADAALAAQKTAETAAETAKAAQKEAEEALAAAKADLETVNKNLTEAQTALITTNADLDAANKKVIDLEKQLEAANAKITALEENADADELLKKQVADLTEQLEAAKTAQATAEKAQATAEAAAAAAKVAQSNAEKEAADAKTAQAAAEKAQATAEAAAETAKAAQTKAETAQATAEAAQAKAEKDLAAANADLKAANAKVADLTEQLAAAEKQIEELEAAGNADEALQKQVTELKTQLEAAKTAQAAAEKTQATAEAAAETAKAAQAKAEKELATANADLKAANAKVADLTEQLETAEKHIAELEASGNADEALQKQVAELKAQLEAAKTSQADAEKEAAAQKAAAEKATADKEAAEKALAEANEKLAATQAELETAQTDLAAAQKSLDKANADLKAANASVADLTEQLTAAEEKIAALEDGAEADELLQKEIADLKEKLEAAKTAKTAAEEAQATAEAEAKTAQANAEKAAAAQKKAEEAQATAEAAKAKAEKELEELKASLVKTTIKIGDVDSDGTVDTKDAMLFTRYYNGDESVTIDLRAADLDRDGEVTLRDVMILTRYVNGWEGYDTYIVDAEI